MGRPRRFSPQPVAALFSQIDCPDGAMKIFSVLACLFLLSSTGHAAAGERPLIWQPVKNSQSSYTARIGARMPTLFKPAAGVEFGLVTTDGGELVDTPMAAWSRPRSPMRSEKQTTEHHSL